MTTTKNTNAEQIKDMIDDMECYIVDTISDSLSLLGEYSTKKYDFDKMDCDFDDKKASIEQEIREFFKKVLNGDVFEELEEEEFVEDDDEEEEEEEEDENFVIFLENCSTLSIDDRIDKYREILFDENHEFHNRDHDLFNIWFNS